MLLLVIPILISCIGERCSSCSEEKGYMEQYKVTFWGNYAVTKSTSAIPAGVESSIFTYYSGEDPAFKKEHTGTPALAVSNLSGNLLFSNNFTLYLAPGYYDFYAISTNSCSLKELSVNMGQSNSLKNGIDYLWAQSRDITICNHSNVHFNFVHAAASLAIEINPQFDSQLATEKMELTKVLLGVPDTTQTLTLSNGKITPANTILNEKEEMNVNGNRATYIILPLQKEIDIPVELYLTTTSDTNQKTREKYVFSIPPPANGFEAGTQYSYKVKIRLNKIIFESTSIEPWNNQEIDNIFLSEKN